MNNPNTEGASIGMTRDTFQILAPRGNLSALARQGARILTVTIDGQAAYNLTPDQARSLGYWLIQASDAMGD